MKIRINKEYVLLALLIASTLGYLIYQKADRIHYRLPKTAPLKPDEITSMEIAHDGGTTILRKAAGGTWIIEPAGWKADPAKIGEMKEAMAGLAITDLVSETGDYARYRLDGRNRGVIRAYAGKRIVRDLFVGKAAPTYNHTYVMLPGDERVYLAGGDLGRLFMAPAGEIRDMLVFSVSSPEVVELRIEHEGAKAVLTRSPAQGRGKAAQEIQWKNESGSRVDKADVDGLLAALAKIYCGEYLADSEKGALKAPVTTIEVMGPSRAVLSVYEEKNGKIPAVSSQNPSPFVMPDYKHEEIKKAVFKILGRIDPEAGG